MVINERIRWTSDELIQQPYRSHITIQTVGSEKLVYPGLSVQESALHHLSVSLRVGVRKAIFIVSFDM